MKSSYILLLIFGLEIAPTNSASSFSSSDNPFNSNLNLDNNSKSTQGIEVEENKTTRPNTPNSIASGSIASSSNLLEDNTENVEKKIKDLEKELSEGTKYRNAILSIGGEIKTAEASLDRAKLFGRNIKHNQEKLDKKLQELETTKRKLQLWEEENKDKLAELDQLKAKKERLEELKEIKLNREELEIQQLDTQMTDESKTASNAKNNSKPRKTKKEKEDERQAREEEERRRKEEERKEKEERKKLEKILKDRVKDRSKGGNPGKTERRPNEEVNTTNTRAAPEELKIKLNNRDKIFNDLQRNFKSENGKTSKFIDLIKILGESQLPTDKKEINITLNKDAFISNEKERRDDFEAIRIIISKFPSIESELERFISTLFHRENLAIEYPEIIQTGGAFFLKLISDGKISLREDYKFSQMGFLMMQFILKQDKEKYREMETYKETKIDHLNFSGGAYFELLYTSILHYLSFYSINRENYIDRGGFIYKKLFRFLIHKYLQKCAFESREDLFDKIIIERSIISDIFA